MVHIMHGIDAETGTGKMTVWGIHNDTLTEELVNEGFVSIGWDEIGTFIRSLVDVTNSNNGSSPIGPTVSRGR